MGLTRLEIKLISTSLRYSFCIAQLPNQDLSFHVHSLPQFHPDPLMMAALGSSRRPMNPDLSQFRSDQFLNVVPHAVQIPLRVELGMFPVIQTR